MPMFPFEVPYDDVDKNILEHVAAICSCLESSFLSMPRGNGFIEYGTFEDAYEELKRRTKGFSELNGPNLLHAVQAKPVAFIVIRSMLGFTPPEWAYVTTVRSNTSVSQGAARGIDRKIRMNPEVQLPSNGVTSDRITAMAETAAEILTEGATETTGDEIHRLSKADTDQGLDSLKLVAELGVPYAMLLYERFLGRPFASHRDSISELVGDTLEIAIEKALTKAGITYVKTGRAQVVPGFDQAPDFIIPSVYNPKVVIEAKITEDDGTARDKVTRIQHLDRLREDGPGRPPKFEVIACIGGRGFAQRKSDMEKMIRATRGKVFTVRNLDKMVDCT
ncbi:hypothetical protein SAMN02745216_05063 [Desulfatibacillum alkenivorans DSM 16219]|jgi:hypothetical protein|uniref:Restriction endonuclease n=1 Tax=Desulfatibacillum alkenivorans DSM 16219 TaxID=1121393 RepID=A0A1M6ZYN2_9BACT|nr:hypothetical protein [Desulfatibacillum alkenivorans]SHL35597.1 hypothetical protein SAMN02745216_05063 [Desulfatibacillum alkenivorans DSM 16219]